MSGTAIHGGNNKEDITSSKVGDKVAMDVNVLSGGEASGGPESGTDATGQDAFATILTPTQVFGHLMIVNEGANAAVVSLDGGTTDDIIRVAGQSVLAFDDIAITTAAIQAKNAGAGENYSDLTIIVW